MSTVHHRYCLAASFHANPGARNAIISKGDYRETMIKAWRV
jgi:hypothetical protein